MTLEEQLSSEERATITQQLEEMSAGLWRRRVEEPLAAGRYIAAAIEADVLASPFPREHDAHRRAKQVRETAAATISAASSGSAAKLLDVVQMCFAGQSAARLERDGFAVRFERPAPGTCAGWPAPPVESREALPASVTLTSEACEETTRTWQTTETYEEAVWREREIPGGRTCSTRPATGFMEKEAYGKGSMINECTTTYARKESYQTTVTKSRTVDHIEAKLRWRGVATIRFPGGTVELPFDVEGTGEDASHNAPSRHGYDPEEARRKAWRTTTLEMFRRIEKRLVEASAEAAVQEGKTAHAERREADADEAFARAVTISADAPAAAFEWFDSRYGLERRRLLDVFDGTPWMASFVEPVPTADFDPGRVDCPMCLAMRTKPLDRAMRGLNLVGLTYARTGTGSNALFASVDIRTTDGFGAGLGLDLGYAFGGLLYGTSVRLGYGVATARLRAGLNAGGGLSGVAWGDVPFAFELPVEAAAAYALLPSVRLVATVRASWVTASEREAGAPDAPFADELRATAGLQLGRFDYADAGQGFYLGVDMRELMGTRSLGITLAVLGF